MNLRHVYALLQYNVDCTHTISDCFTHRDSLTFFSEQKGWLWKVTVNTSLESTTMMIWLKQSNYNKGIVRDLLCFSTCHVQCALIADKYETFGGDHTLAVKQWLFSINCLVSIPIFLLRHAFSRQKWYLVVRFSLTPIFIDIQDIYRHGQKWNNKCRL